MSDLGTFLYGLLEQAALPLPGVARKRMFGCDAVFADGNIFGLIWKTGRIGVKLPDPAAFDELMALPGAEPWKAGEKVMGGWMLVPESFHDDPAALSGWVRRAHALAIARGPKPPKSPKKAARR